jgi:lysine-N-methylase
MQLAVLSDALDEATAAKRGSDVPQIIQMFRDQLDSEGKITRVDTFPVNQHFQVKFLNDLLLTLVRAKMWNNARYKECLDQYIEGIQTAGSELTEEQLVRFYEQCRRDYYDPFMAVYHYIFENYIVNHIFGTVFPYSLEPNMFDKVFYIGVVYALLRLQLIGMAAYHKGLTADLVIKLIQSFTRNFEHSQNFKKVLHAKCKTDNALTLGHLSLLVME